jgi:hypothetical protein
MITILLAVAAGVAVFLWLPPGPQPAAHQPSRTSAPCPGMPNALNVLSSAAFPLARGVSHGGLASLLPACRLFFAGPRQAARTVGAVAVADRAAGAR